MRAEAIYGVVESVAAAGELHRSLAPAKGASLRMTPSMSRTLLTLAGIAQQFTQCLNIFGAYVPHNKVAQAILSPVFHVE